jgi:hypothetical protein
VSCVLNGGARSLRSAARAVARLDEVDFVDAHPLRHLEKELDFQFVDVIAKDACGTYFSLLPFFLGIGCRRLFDGQIERRGQIIKRLGILVVIP